MAVLGVESSAHTLGMGIVQDGKVVANEKLMYQIADKGMIPSKVADFHVGNVGRLLKATLRAAGLSLDDIDAVGYTKGPGMGACLRVGHVCAAYLSDMAGVPIFPVNHGLAHIEVAKSLLGIRDPIALYVSGGNSQIVAARGKPAKYHIYGETFDMGIGNMIDSFARAAGLNPAWGSTVAKTAMGGKYLQMPYTVRGMDFTFTGLLTNAVGMLKGHNIRDVSYSLQETAFSMLCEATERALLLTKKREVVLCGGVAQSPRLREMVSDVASEHDARFGAAADEFNADNGAMIAVVAEKMLKSGMHVSKSDCTTSQRYRLEGVRVP